jgi:small subunit ribosomal protein S9
MMVAINISVAAGPLDAAIMGRYVVGRRKAAVARVLFRSGVGRVVVNGRESTDCFKLQRYLHSLQQPLKIAIEQDERFAGIDVHCRVVGGGTTGQAEAVRLAVARKVVELSSALRPLMRSLGYLTCDSRRVESKHYGLHKARRRPQYAKR